MIFAIDPGSDKTGTALLADDGALVAKYIVPTASLVVHMNELSQRYPIGQVVMGDGTNHKRLQPLVEAWISQQDRPPSFTLVDEKFTTVEGRRLYWQHTPRHGWRRLLPVSWQYPPEPVDDFVAWIIGLRYLTHRWENK